MENSILLKVVFCAFLFSSTIGNALTIKEAEEKANQVCAQRFRPLYMDGQN